MVPYGTTFPPQKRGNNKAPRNITIISCTTLSTGCTATACGVAEELESHHRPENPVTRFPLGKGGAVRHHLYPKGAAHRTRRLCRRVEEKGSKGCGGALRAHYTMAPPAPPLPPRSGLYNSPLNQPGRRSRFRAEPKAAQGRSPGGGLNPLNPLAFGNTAF